MCAAADEQADSQQTSQPKHSWDRLERQGTGVIRGELTFHASSWLIMADHQGTLGRTGNFRGPLRQPHFSWPFVLGSHLRQPIKAGLLGLPGDVLRSVSVSPGRKQISCKRQELKFGAAFLIWVCLKMERNVRYPSNFHSKHEDKP